MKRVVWLVLCAGLLLISCGGRRESAKSGDKAVVEKESVKKSSLLIDAAGRTVTVPENLDNGIVTLGGCGPLRFLSIFDLFNSVIEVDKGDVTDSKNGRGYSYAYSYDSFGPDKYHPDNKLESETVEKIGQKEPSLIIVQKRIYDNYTENCELLASRFPLVVLPDQRMTELWNSNYELADWYVQAVNIVGAATGREEKAAEHIKDVNEIIADIRSLSGESDKSVYVAGLTWMGSNELTTTFPSYLPLMLVGAKNAHGGNETSRVVMDPEAVTGIDMDYMVIDPSSANKLSTPNSQLILEWIYKRNTDDDDSNNIRLFATLPIVWDHVNYDCALAGAYFLDHLVYGTLSIEEVESKINNVFETYYGENGKKVLNGMKLFFQGKSSAYGVQLPLLRELKVVESKGQYVIKGL